MKSTNQIKENETPKKIHTTQHKNFAQTRYVQFVRIKKTPQFLKMETSLSS